VALLLVVLNLLGVDVHGWLTHLWDQLKAVPVGYLVAGVLLQVAQTTFNGVAYYGILRYAYPDAGVALWPIVTAYAVGVGMNSFLPANIGTFVTLLMFVAIVPGSSFAGIFAAYVVNKIFFTVVGAVVYGLLFLQAGAAFDVELGWFRHHALLALLIIVGGAFLIFVLGRMFWHKLKGLWEKAEQGGKILTDPRAYATRVLTWQVLSYAAKLGVIAVFLAAYSIPVTFGSVVHVIGSSSAANVTSVTPGAVGVTQAANAAALRDYTDGATATAYSLSQQLVTSATNVVYALVLVLLIFGWTGGKALVSTSYSGAKEKVHKPKHDEPEATGAGGDA
ncbi:MAG: lysylphosphatidylglycerol synthase domain-containing protein, partial [Solirubrobacterales bacterium]